MTEMPPRVNSALGVVATRRTELALAAAAADENNNIRRRAGVSMTRGGAEVRSLGWGGGGSGGRDGTGRGVVGGIRIGECRELRGEETRGF